MNKTIYLEAAVFEYARTNANRPQWAKVYKALNEERISSIVLDGDVFWFEHNMNHEPVAESVYNTIKDYLGTKGYLYLYAT